MALVAGATLIACSGGGDGASAQAASAPDGSDARVSKAAPARAATLPPGVFEMSRARIMDPSGFEKPLLAATVLVPAGWRTEGGVVWGPHGLCGADYAAKWQAASPDGASAVLMVPMPNWSGVRSAYPTGPESSSCPQAFHTSLRGFLEGAAQQLFPGARALDYRGLDDEIRPLREMVARLPALPPVQGYESQITVDAGELLVGFTENGRDMRASVSAIATISRTRMADLLNPGRIGFESVQGTPANFVVVKAPNGQLDLGLRRRVLSSMRFDGEWSRRVNEFTARKQAEQIETNRKIAEINAAGSAARLQASAAAHQGRMQTLRETTDIMNGIYNDRQLSSDRQQRERIEAIRGVETYNDPVAGRPVQLDNTYQHAWRVKGRDDTYILTNDVNFNPGVYDIEAQQMKPLP